MFIGRQRELSLLQEKYEKKQQLIVIYGRRRIGKSHLIKEFCKNKKALFFEGLEGERTPQQIAYFVSSLADQIGEDHLRKTKFSNWDEVFQYLTKYLKDRRLVIVFDELQWMAAGQGHFISLFKSYWDQHWKQLDGVFILCGSLASYMVKKVIHSKALYGRINLEINLGPLNASDSRKILNRRSPHEALLYLMVFGGVPKYLEEVNQSRSFAQNINRLCFQKDGLFVDEVNKVFYSQFKESATYQKIVRLLSSKNLSLSQIARTLKMPPSGGLKGYLTNLEAAGFVRTYSPLGERSQKAKKYKLFDEFLIFYLKYMQSHRHQIQSNEDQNLFSSLVQPIWAPWLGIAFETFCLKNAMLIAKKMGIAEYVVECGPIFSADSKNGKFQIDLAFLRRDKTLTICELKYSKDHISTAVIPEMERKINQMLHRKKDVSIEKCLITSFGADPHLTKAQYFDHIITIEELLGG